MRRAILISLLCLKAVEVQSQCPPAQPGISPEPEPDEFGSSLDGANTHVLDGNGPVGSCSPAFPGSFPATGNWTAPLYAASVAGVPPTAGFFTKFYLFRAAVGAGGE